MITISLAVPRDHARLITDLIHLNGYKFRLEQPTDGPAMILIELDPATIGAEFNPRDTIKPIASC